MMNRKGSANFLKKYQRRITMTIKEKIIDLLRSTERPGIEKLIEYMENNGFYSAPCSGAYHLCKEGGLAEHSLNVYEFGHGLLLSGIQDFGFNKNIDSWIIVSFLHDLGKMGQYNKPNYVPNYLKDGKQSPAKPFETNKSLLPVPHEIRSIHIASQFIELTEDEAFAILHHNGMYGDLKYQLQGKETPLQQILHFADMYCSRFIEVTPC
jgi:23S rRNA maturation-related 3'-5' exoribonuclease YhaM